MTKHVLGEEEFDVGSNKASRKELLEREPDVHMDEKEVHATDSFKSGAFKVLGNKRSKSLKRHSLGNEVSLVRHPPFLNAQVLEAMGTNV